MALRPARWIIAIIGLLATVLCCCLPAIADGDGAYCTAKNFIAYDVNRPLASGESGHILRVVWFGTERGIQIGGETSLKIALAHHLVCTANQIEVFGWADTFRSYTFAAAQTQSLKMLNHHEDPTKRFDPATNGPEPSRFDDKPPGSVPLESSDLDHKYALLRSASEREVEGGVEHHIKAELIESDLRGNETRRFLLYEDTELETID